MGLPCHHVVEAGRFISSTDPLAGFELVAVSDLPGPEVVGVRIFTSLGVRYAYGWGHVQGITFDVASDDDAGFAWIDAPVQRHELAFNLGGGVNF